MRYRIMDTASDATLDDLTKLASELCETPIALVSLVDDTRQWFKSRIGLSATETPREIAFCVHAIGAGNDLFVVPDAAADSRFANNPLVTADPNIRFYAGAPLRMSDGHRLGTLCVIDRVPRELDSKQQRVLGTLRNAVVTQLELRRALSDIEDAARLLSMCSWCRRIEARGSWVPVHEYVVDSTDVNHVMCQACSDKIG